MIKNAKGFTLAEIMIGVGISSFIGLIIMQTLDRSSTGMRSAEQIAAINDIVFTATTLLEKQDSCRQSLTGFAANGAYPAGSSITLRRSSGTAVFTPGQVVGNGAGRIQIDDIILSNHEDNTAPHFNGADQATVTFILRRASAIGVDLTTITDAQRNLLIKREGTSRLLEEHRIPVSVEINEFTNLVSACKYGVISTASNTQAACNMLGGEEIANGRCVYLNIQAETVGVRGVFTPISTGPDRAMLFTDGHMTVRSENFMSTTLQLNTNAAPAYSGSTLTLEGENLSANTLGSVSTPAGNGLLDFNGLVVLGSNPDAFINGLNTDLPTTGMAISGDLVFTPATTQRLYINAQLPIINSSSSSEDKLVSTAEWAAQSIADAAGNSAATAAAIQSAILSGGSTSARNAIFAYMCENLVMQQYDTGQPEGLRNSDNLSQVTGVWDSGSGQCRINGAFKRNCSTSGNCQTVQTNRLCLSGSCMSRWPSLIRNGGCAWQNSCTGTQRQFAYRNIGYGSPQRLCCSVRMSDF